MLINPFQQHFIHISVNIVRKVTKLIFNSVVNGIKLFSLYSKYPVFDIVASIVAASKQERLSLYRVLFRQETQKRNTSSLYRYVSSCTISHLGMILTIYARNEISIVFVLFLNLRAQHPPPPPPNFVIRRCAAPKLQININGVENDRRQYDKVQ